MTSDTRFPHSGPGMQGPQEEQEDEEVEKEVRMKDQGDLEDQHESSGLKGEVVGLHQPAVVEAWEGVHYL